jgi:hypothetical protein
MTNAEDGFIEASLRQGPLDEANAILSARRRVQDIPRRERSSRITDSIRQLTALAEAVEGRTCRNDVRTASRTYWFDHSAAAR